MVNGIYRYQDKDFCERVYEVIRICINNRGASYNFMVDDKKIVNNIDNSDRSIGNITNSTIGDDNTINIGGNTGIQAGGDVVGNDKIQKSGLTLEEWNSLEQFFLNEKNTYQDNSEVRVVCEQILEHIKKKDEKSLKSFLKTCSRGALKAIAGSKAVDGFNVAMNILKKLVK